MNDEYEPEFETVAAIHILAEDLMIEVLSGGGVRLVQHMGEGKPAHVLQIMADEVMAVRDILENAAGATHW